MKREFSNSDPILNIKERYTHSRCFDLYQTQRSELENSLFKLWSTILMNLYQKQNTFVDQTYRIEYSNRCGDLSCYMYSDAWKWWINSGCMGLGVFFYILPSSSSGLLANINPCTTIGSRHAPSWLQRYWTSSSMMPI